MGRGCVSLIKDMPRVERPRERMMRYGPDKLSDEELLALLLRTGVRGTGVMDFAAGLVKRFGREGLARAGFAELKSAHGLGPARACEIMAAFELGRRVLGGKKTSVYLKPRDVWEELRDIREQKKEHFVVFFLDTRNQEIKRDIVSIGTLNYNLVHPREVFEPAVKNLAAGVIVAHNHPSGCLEPSDEDISLTKRLAEAGRLLGIELLDHVIVAKGGWLSFKEKGLMR
ncbi:MAG: DNA repair protein RadC [Elusimicrobia bacterium]|nr:MAG: DNA repair protein RadC [Elusimicrobiota bacterium]KAF0155234.1 MAG: DNA repair protein RadC [Elusimicrobiota bacterium]